MHLSKLQNETDFTKLTLEWTSFHCFENSGFIFSISESKMKMNFRLLICVFCVSSLKYQQLFELVKVFAVLFAVFMSKCVMRVL